MRYLKYLMCAFVLSLGAVAFGAPANAAATKLPVAIGQNAHEGLVQNVRMYCHWVTRCHHRSRYSGRICRRVRVCH
jgi:hypothetical protein